MPETERRRTRLLAVSHQASETGAPIVLAHVLRWIRHNAEVDIHTLLVADGPLRPRFEEVGTVSAVTDLPGAHALGLAERGLVLHGNLGLRKVPANVRYRPAMARLGRFDVVYLNSISTLEALPYLKRGPQVIAHIHEGAVGLGLWRRLNGPLRPDAVPDRWIAVSEDGAEALATWPEVDPSTISLHAAFIDVDAIRGAPQGPAELASLRAQLGIPEGAAVVVGSGSIDRRKGPDLFVQLAAEVQRHHASPERPVHFVWVGGDPTILEWFLFESDIERSDVDHVHLVPHVADPRPYFQLADVFALTSREDPFPLVCLEHAALGVPVVAYSTSGICSFLAAAGPEAAQGVISYLDVRAMAQQIADLLASPRLADAAGAQLSKAVEEHHDISTAAPALAAELGVGSRGLAGPRP